MINILEIVNGSFKVSNKIKFDKINITECKKDCTKGGEVDLSFLNDIRVEKDEIKTIKIFSNDYISNVRNKIAALLRRDPSHILIFEFQEKIIIDKVNVKVDKNELLLPYSDANNILYKHRQFKILNFDKKFVGELSEFNVLPLDAYVHDDNEVYLYYCMKFWTKLTKESFSHPQIADMNFPSDEFEKINRISYNNTFNINKFEAVSYQNPLDLIEYIKDGVNLKDHDCVFFHIKINSHIVKYTKPNLWKDEYAMEDALTIGVKKGNILLIFHRFLNGKVLIECVSKKVDIDFVEDSCRKSLLVLFGNPDYTITNIRIVNEYSVGYLNSIHEINSKLVNIVYILDDSSRTSVSLSKGVLYETHIHFYIDNNKLISEVDANYKDLIYILKLLEYYKSYKSKVTEVVDLDNINKNKRLLNRDPVAYVMDNNKWSMSCQKKMQPILFNKSEYDVLKPQVKNKCLEYWNFTKEEPAFYYCPDADFPHVYFKDTNPLMALPCCGKRDELSISEIHREAYQKTIETRVYHKPELNINYAYVINYGKIIPPGRISNLPDVFPSFELDYVLYNGTVDIESSSEIKLTDIGGALYISEFFIAKKYNIKLHTSNGVYPIVNIDKQEFVKTQQISHTTFDADSDIIQFLFQFRKQMEYERILSIIKLKIVCEYVHNDIILFILFKSKNSHVLIPVNEKSYITDGNTNIPDLKKLNLDKKLLLDVCKKLYPDFYISKNVISGGKSIGFVFNNNVYFHNPEVYKSGDKLHIPYDIMDIYKSIKETKPSNIIFEYKNISKLYEEKYQIIKNIQQSKNKFIRAKLKVAIDDLNITQIGKLVGANDYIIIKQKILEQRDSTEILDDLFEFDKKSVDIKKINHKVLIEFINGAVENPILKHTLYNNIRLFNSRDVKLYEGEYISVYNN